MYSPRYEGADWTVKVDDNVRKATVSVPTFRVLSTNHPCSYSYSSAMDASRSQRVGKSIHLNANGLELFYVVGRRSILNFISCLQPLPGSFKVIINLILQTHRPDVGSRALCYLYCWDLQPQHSLSQAANVPLSFRVLGCMFSHPLTAPVGY